MPMLRHAGASERHDMKAHGHRYFFHLSTVLLLYSPDIHCFYIANTRKIRRWSIVSCRSGPARIGWYRIITRKGFGSVFDGNLCCARSTRWCWDNGVDGFWI